MQLMSRAPGRCVAALPAAAILLAATAHAQATEWSFQGSALQHPGFVGPPDGLPVGWVNYDNITPTIAGQPVPDGMKIYGTGQNGDLAFAVRGFEYIGAAVPTDGGIHGNQLIMVGSATFDPSQWTSDSAIRTAFDFGFTFNSGTLDITNVSTSYTLLDAQNGFVAGGGSSGFNAFDLTAGDYFYGFAYQDGFGPNVQDGATIQWQVTMNFDWFDPDPEGTLRLYIPQNSIDLQVIPSSGTATLLCVGAVAAGWRRRR